MAKIHNFGEPSAAPRLVKSDKGTEKENNEKKVSFHTKLRRHRLIVFYRTALICAVIVALIVLYMIYAENKVYTEYTVNSQTEWTDNSGIEVISCGGNLLTYSKDGAVCTDLRGHTLWNQSFEMQNPIVVVRGEYIAIGDYNGTTVYVMNASGPQGTIDTRMPIRALDVSEKGTVAAVLDDAPTTWVYLFSKEGTVLLGAKTSMVDSGYPLNVAISNDSLMMAVSYLYAGSGELTSKVAFYNLQEVGDNYLDQLVSVFNYVDAVVPMVRFMDNENSFAVADNRLMFYRGRQIPTSTKEIILSEEVRDVFYGTNYVGLIYLNTDGSTKYQMDTYDTNGSLVFSYEFDREYQDILFENEFVYIYNESGCDIYNMKGVLKFDGEFESPVACLIPGASKERLTLVSRDIIFRITLK